MFDGILIRWDNSASFRRQYIRKFVSQSKHFNGLIMTYQNIYIFYPSVFKARYLSSDEDGKKVRILELIKILHCKL